MSVTREALAHLRDVKEEVARLGVNPDDYFTTGANKHRVIRNRKTGALVAGPCGTTTEAWEDFRDDLKITKEKQNVK